MLVYLSVSQDIIMYIRIPWCISGYLFVCWDIFVYVRISWCMSGYLDVCQDILVYDRISWCVHVLQVGHQVVLQHWRS